MEVEPQGLQYALFSREQSRSSALVRALRDIVRFCLFLFEIRWSEEGRVERGEVGVDVHNASWRFGVCGEFGGEIEGRS